MRRILPDIKAEIKKNHILHSALQWIGPLYRKTEQRYRKRFPLRLSDMDVRSGPEKKKTQLKKRALVSYIVHPFTISREDPLFYRHSNIWQTQEIVRILNRLGFLVDVIDFRDKTFIPKKDYDLFLGHGDTTFLSIGNQLPGKSKKIYYSTSNHWRYRNRVVAQRYADLSKRKGVEIRPDKMIPSILEDVITFADGIIGIGGNFAKETYAGYDPSIMVDNTAFPDDVFDFSRRNYGESRSHFLFFAGDDNIRKGLDLLLEAFSEVRAHLWICTFIDKTLKNLYAKELHQLPNIHLIGSIMPRSNKFYEMMNRCAFSVLPTCSEGQPGTVVESMYYGLAQLISPACSVEIDGFGELLWECNIKEIRKKVIQLKQLNPEMVCAMSKKARDVAISRFSPKQFSINMAAALKKIL